MSAVATCASAPSTAWRGRLELGYRRGATRTELRHCRHLGPLRVQRPFYPEPAGVCHTYVLHPPGGLVGGDEIALQVSLGADASALLTTPGASKVYRSDGAHVRITQEFSVAPGALLEWLPQEAIYFDGARAQAQTRVALAGDARFIGWDITCLGRPASALDFRTGLLDVRFELRHEGRPRLLERLHVRPGAGPDARPASWREHHATGTLVATGVSRAADGAGLLTALRVVTDAAPCPAGLSVVDDVLVCRALARDALDLRALFVSLWMMLRPALHGLAGCMPRIWQT